MIIIYHSADDKIYKRDNRTVSLDNIYSFNKRIDWSNLTGIAYTTRLIHSTYTAEKYNHRRTSLDCLGRQASIYVDYSTL